MAFMAYADLAVAPIAPVFSGYRHWRIDSKGTINTYYFSAAELQFRQTVGVNELHAGGVASASSVYGNSPAYAADLAFDGNASTAFVSQGGDASVGWLRYSFAAPREVKQVLIRCGPSVPYAEQTPVAFDLRYSDDGTTWVTVKSFTGITWTSGETKLFTV